MKTEEAKDYYRIVYAFANNLPVLYDDEPVDELDLTKDWRKYTIVTDGLAQRMSVISWLRYRSFVLCLVTYDVEESKDKPPEKYRIITHYDTNTSVFVDTDGASWEQAVLVNTSILDAYFGYDIT